nr:histidinol dehydrogenase [Pseudomonadota bacterium]
MSLRLRRLKTSDAGFAAELADVLAYAADVDAEVETSVARILADVQARGDAAVLDYTRRYDQVDAASLASLEIAPAQLRAACDGLPAAQRSALE